VLGYKARKCLACGAQVITLTEVIETEGELVEFGSRRSGKLQITELDKEEFYRELKWLQAHRGHKSGWCWHKFKERFKGEQPPKWFEILEPREPSISTKNWIKSRAIAFAKIRGVMARPNKISGQFAARLIEMMESPAYRVLSLSAHRALSRIEIEWARHGGQDNGRLPVTFDDFERYGVNRHAIGPAIAELEALGFIVITERGKMAKAAEYRRPNKFLLTSRPTNKGADPLHNWKRFTTMEEAQAIAEAARKLSGEKKKEPVRKTHREPVRKTHYKGQIASTENAPLRTSETAPLSISREGTPDIEHADEPTGLGMPLADAAPTPRLLPPPAPPSPLVLWAQCPSRPRQPATLGTVSPRKRAPGVIVEPIDGSYLIGGRRIDVLDQTRRTVLPSNADKPVRPRLTVIAAAPTPAIAAE
jgi:hypothetical protein